MQLEKDILVKKLIKRKLEEAFQPKSGNEPKKPKMNCAKCASPSNKDDKRNHIFSQLLEEELNHVKPCVRTKCYSDILQFVQLLKGEHNAEADTSDDENN